MHFADGDKRRRLRRRDEGGKQKKEKLHRWIASTTRTVKSETMTKLLNCVLLLILPLVKGSSLLQYKSDSAYCTGNLTDLVFVSAECLDNEYGCTWGSNVSLFVQVNATADFPEEISLSVLPSAPHLPESSIFGSYEYQNYTSYSCGTKLKAPAGSDAGYSCPDAGVYNFRTNFQMLGHSDAWYGSYHGFNLGLNVHVLDAENDVGFAYCYMELQVKTGTYSPATDWAIFGGGLAGIAAAGYMYRKRRIATLDLHSDYEDETVTNFELVSDQLANV